MLDENESTIADATGPIAPESPVRSPADVQAMFDRAKFMTMNKHIHYLGSPLHGHVYVMSAGEFVKIGIAISPASRLKGIQCGCPLLVSIERAWRLSDDYYALLSEKVSHEILKPYRAQGEWFRAPVALAVETVREVANASVDLSWRHSNYKRRIDIQELGPEAFPIKRRAAAYPITGETNA